MLLSCEQMRSAEDEAFSRGVSAARLMDIAGRGIARCIGQFFPAPATCIAWCGKGNNAGDALVAARYLKAWGWKIQTRFTHSPNQLSPLALRQMEQLGSVDTDSPRRGPLVVLDGLLGIGASGELRQGIAEAVAEINRLRREEGAFVVALDIPTGLNGDTGEAGSVCIQADLTVTMGFAKQGLLADTAANYVGRLAVVELRELETPANADPAELATPALLKGRFPPRDFDTHKGNHGRIGIIAGSPGFYGAARLCSAGAVAAGGGLVSLFAGPEAYDALSTSLIPEVMVQRVDWLTDVLDERLDVLAIGPGIGFDRSREVLSIIQSARIPVIIDADALTIVSRNPSILRNAAGPRLLTPHPGEFERMDPGGKGDRRSRLEAFVKARPVTLLLKGARTVIGAAGRPVVFNTTGNPGMGTGGMGDVLTGVCAALCARPGGDDMVSTAAIAAWACGRSAEVAIFEKGESPESLRATHVLENLGNAFRQLREGVL